MFVKSTGLLFIMTKSIFVFIASFLLLLPFVLTTGGISTSYQLIICLPFILFLGIPHGAIDNVLYIRNKGIKNIHFISVYIAFILLNIALWFIFPWLAYMGFLLLSAYHFGQSQFSHYFNNQALYKQLLYLFWGISILSALIYFNMADIEQLMLQEEEFAVFRQFHQENLLFILFLGSSILSFTLMFLLHLKKELTLESFFMETLVFSLILICFFLMPLLIGFTLYFVILHSFKVLREEYFFLNSENKVSSVSDFIKLVSPFTLLSIFGILMIYASIHFELLELPYGYSLLIIISSITLPHVFVMNRFYSLFKKG